jgi:hypothetical protein
MRRDEGNSRTDANDGTADNRKMQTGCDEIRSRFASVFGPVLFAVVVEAEVGDEAFAHDVAEGVF